MNYICPICYQPLKESEYLRYVFVDDDYAYQIALNITEYRHKHINYYDSTWKSWAYASKNPEYRDGHEAFKIKVNNRAKRQIMRALMKSNFKDQMKINLIKAIVRMQNNDKETIALRRKMLDKLRHKTNKAFWDTYQPKEFELIEIKNESNMRGVEFQLFEERYKQARLEI